MKIVITGGAGFLGSWLCERMLDAGNEVLCIDNMSTCSGSNIFELRKQKNFLFSKKDITGVKTLKKFDVIFHLASPASPVYYQKYPIETMLANSIGTKNVLDMAKRHKAKVIFSSTSEVYGDPNQHPQREDYWGNVNPNGVRSCYDESKRFAEALCMTYFRKGLDVRIARIFNTYGPRMDANDGRVIPSFITQALKNVDIMVHGKGKQTRSFCYVSDMVRGLVAMSEKDVAGDVINLGNPDEHNIKDIAQKIKKLSESQSMIVFDEMPKDDPSRRKPDISKAKSPLEWKPHVSIDDGLKNTIDHFKSKSYLLSPKSPVF